MRRRSSGASEPSRVRTSREGETIRSLRRRSTRDRKGQEKPMTVFEKIEAQQKGREGTAPWMVGEQLKEICRREPQAAELVDKDLDVKEMSLAACEKKIAEWARAHKNGYCAVVPPNVAEEIIRKFYGIPGGERIATSPSAPRNDRAGEGGCGGEIVDISAFL